MANLTLTRCARQNYELLAMKGTQILTCPRSGQAPSVRGSPYGRANMRGATCPKLSVVCQFSDRQRAKCQLPEFIKFVWLLDSSVETVSVFEMEWPASLL
eukprot:sb/3478591/